MRLRLLVSSVLVLLVLILLGSLTGLGAVAGGALSVSGPIPKHFCPPYPPAKTGQIDCWDEYGDPIGCTDTGQDGEYRSGILVNPRFTDNGDGTVTDNLTALIWLKDADCFAQESWTHALSQANGLRDGWCGLTDGSVAGDWRLPNVKELLSLIDFGQSGPALPPGHPFSGVQIGPWSLYWSSTSEYYPVYAWGVYLGSGTTLPELKTGHSNFLPVRGPE